MSETAIYKLEKFISSGEMSMKLLFWSKWLQPVAQVLVSAIMDTQELDCEFHN